jgi:hypothetical protein
MQPKGNDFKALQVLHVALLTGMLMLGVVSTFLIISHGPYVQLGTFEKTLQIIVVLLSIGCTAAGFTLFNKKIQAIPPMDPIKDRLNAYRAAAIVRWALIELPTLFSLISFLLTGNYAFLALAIALLLVFAVVRPAKMMIIYQLKLNEKEVSELEGASE